jgi:hypothetical protein
MINSFLRNYMSTRNIRNGASFEVATEVKEAHVKLE